MKTTSILLASVALVLGVFGWIDTGNYRSMAQAYEASAGERLQQLQAHVQQDAERYQRCNDMRADSGATTTIDFTPEGRLCLIDAFAQAASVEGTLVLARNASVALGKNPQDDTLRKAALVAIEKSRAMLASQRPWLFDRLEALDRAYDASLVMRMLQEPASGPSRFAVQATLLDQAEFAILLPKVHFNQQVWRLESRLPMSL